MAETTKIEWTHHTFNPWRSCEHARLPDGSEHPGCANCYAEAMSRRNPKTLGVWGAEGTRVLAAEAQWKAVEKWNREAECYKTFDCANGSHSDACPQSNRPRVFCASLADVFEDWTGPMVDAQRRVLHKAADWSVKGQEWIPVDGVSLRRSQVRMSDVRARLFHLIDVCPNLDFLLVTKRPQNVRKFWPQMAGTMVQDFGRVDYRHNVWLLTSVSDQATADAMIPLLLECRDLCPVLGLSIEPLLGPVDLNHLHYDNIVEIDCLNGTHGLIRPHRGTSAKIDWVIIGCESGPNRRPMRLEWAESIVDQCRSAGVKVFVKQVEIDGKVCGDVTKFPASLQVREFPA